jgi:hypothetical protein
MGSQSLCIIICTFTPLQAAKLCSIAERNVSDLLYTARSFELAHFGCLCVRISLQWSANKSSGKRFFASTTKRG